MLRNLGLILIISILLILPTSCIPIQSQKQYAENIEDIEINNLLDFIDLADLFEYYDLFIENGVFAPTNADLDRITNVFQTLSSKANTEGIQFPQYILSTQSADHLRLDIDLHSTLGQRYYLLFRDRSKEELIAFTDFFALQMSDLTSMYAYDGETSLEDLQTLAQKVVDKIVNGQLPLYSKIQRGKYWNSLSPSELDILKALNMEVN